jgi:mRNA interferase RelE/StbE
MAEAHYQLLNLPSVEKELARLPAKPQRQVVTHMLALANDPRPRGMKALKGKSKGLARIDSGDYRIVYQIDDARRTVTVLKIGNRKDVYRGM